jgi:glucose dehydrogenase
MTAVNLNTGEIAWQVPFGDDAQLRRHPALQGVKLPDKLGVAGVQGTIVNKGGLILAGGGDTAVHALDKQKGENLWTYQLRRPSFAILCMSRYAPSGASFRNRDSPSFVCRRLMTSFGRMTPSELPSLRTLS